MLKPDYVKVAEVLSDKKSPIKLAKLNSPTAISLLRKYGVIYYPTLLFFKKGYIMEYEGKLNYDDILSWLLDNEKSQFKQLLTVPNLKNFLTIEARPLIIELTDSNKLLGDVDVNLFLLLVANDTSNEIKKTLRLTAKYFKPVVLFSTVDVTSKYCQTLVNRLRAKPKNTPTSFLLQIRNAKVQKYKPNTNDLTEKNVKEFVQNFLDNKLTPFVFSQDLPKNWNTDAIYTLVRNNYDDVTLDETKHVLVEFYKPECEVCKAFEPIYVQLSTFFKNRKDIVFAKIDLDANELDKVYVKIFPYFRLYTKSQKMGIDYGGPRTFNDFQMFIQRFCKKGLVLEESFER
ncbi:hypothetical protein RN001_009222 [Aquatica leii]|uniref:Thioredoxin domain-containing protein n=1 Tax=Aquatica leii TaxID=1421715 RepID=A0AAN7P7E8_9COLE|nr:hypothetical protein RN001_009222 [Aquatica leii]